jgi:23S rRNA pseudouridine2605 synthase
MNKEFNAGDKPSRSGKSRSPESEENKKNGKEENEESKPFAARNPSNQKSRPKRPRTTRLRPGETRPYDAANNHKSSSDDRGDRPYHDRSNFSFGDRTGSGRSREDKSWGARKPYSPRPGGDRRNSASGEGRSSYSPNRSSGNREGSDGSRRSYNNSDRPQRDQSRYQGDRERSPREGNRAPRDGNRAPRDGNYIQRDGNRTSAYGNRTPRDGNRAESGNYNRTSREKPKFRSDKTKAPYKKFSKSKKSSESENIPIKREFNDAGEMRLNRYLAHAGISSRRQADDYIKAGLVTVNGVVVTEMGVKIKRGDDIRYNGERLATEKKVYILVNKPKDYVTTSDDEMGRKTVLDIVADACPERVYPVGRLDRNTTGVILLTNDGDLAGKLTHPKYNKKKIYHVVLDKNLKQADLEAITEGITLDDGFIQPDAISLVSPEKKNEVGIEIHSGRNRIVRRIFEQLGYDIVRLDRVYFAGLTKKNLARGKWRFLNDKEISMLLMNAYE